MPLICGEDNLKLASTQKMNTFDNSCDAAALKFKLPRDKTFKNRPLLRSKQRKVDQMRGFCILQGTLMTCFQTWWTGP